MLSDRQQYRLVLAVSLAAIACFAAFLALRLNTPFDGARLEPGQQGITAAGLVVAPLVKDTGLQAGDLVVAVQGRPLETWARNLFAARWPRPRLTPGAVLEYTVERQGETLDLPLTLLPYPLWPVVRRNWGTILFALVYLLVAGFVFIRRPGLETGRILFLSAASLAGSTAWSFGLQVGDFTGGAAFWLYKVCTLLFYDLFWISGLHFALIFPRPLPLVRRRRWLLPAMYLLPYALLALYLAASRITARGLLDWFRRWTVAEGVHAALFLALLLITLIFQYRANRRGPYRRQIRWVVLAALLAGGGGLLLYILPPLLGQEAVSPNLAGLIVLPFPLAIAVAILRHNLFDIDRLINRALVYGGLTFLTMALYILVVGVLGGRVFALDRSLVAFLATGLIALLFRPLRDWLQRTANRWMYGERDEPYKVLAALSERIGNTPLPEATLPTLTETIAQTLKLPYAAITLDRAGAEQTLAAYGLPQEAAVSLPLRHHGELIGHLRVAPRARDDSFTPAEMELLASIANQASAVVHNVRLMDELRRARQHLVSAREEERRRMRRDLHDGLGPQLASQTLTLSAARRLLRQDPAAADELLQQAIAHARTATEDVRRVVYGLRPPALDDLGLAGALQALVRRFQSEGLAITLRAPEELPALPAAVEAACYLIAQEACTNVARHAGARCCEITLTLAEGLTLDVRDDGSGLPQDVRSGVGLHSMRQRAEELGGRFQVGSLPEGGTRVFVYIPLNEAED